MVARLTTDDVATSERFDFWHEVICDAFVRLEAEALPGRGPFRAEIANADLGPLNLSRVDAAPHRVRRSAALIGDEPRDEILVSIQIRGTAIVEQDSRQAVLQPGDFVMYDATRPYDLTMPKQFEMLVLQFDRQFLLERCPSPGALTAIRIANNNMVTAPVSAFLRSLEPIAFGGDDKAVSRQLATSALDLLGVALADQFGNDASPGSEHTKLYLRACTYINAFADDPDLAPVAVAAATGVSVRHLHQLFKDHGTSVGRYTMSRRLTKCMDELLSSQYSQRTITEISLSHGFKTAAHFSRSFSEAYGMTPTEARRGVPPDTSV